ncbi:EAL domain-containing protein [Maribrevibacterium harenarium]|uniref:EAL domain-containing protein n=1 Tax=Maribrevibacterium harenarium TaxID=2589817 RepID=A0A501X4T6_9GAMM|nr:EAL domain-containing protein [Maribrevibacterium harenarium]TPE55526.1 EAL domain-containing protein [Maribrevibacterium harenarium]
MNAHRTTFKSIYLIALLFCGISLVAWHQASSFTELRPLGSSKDVLSYTFVDDGSVLSVEQIQSQAYRAAKHGDLSFGYQSDALLVRVTLPQGVSQDAILVVDYSLLDRLELWQISDTKVVGQWQSGDMQPFSSRPLASRQFLFPLVETSSPTELFLMAQSEGTLKVPLYFSSFAVEDARGQYTSMLLGGYLGFIALMMLVSVMMALIAGDRTYRIYMLYVASIGLFNAQMTGLLFQWVWPESPKFNASFTNVAIYLSAACQIWFVMAFLNVKSKIALIIGRGFVLICILGMASAFRPNTYALLTSVGTVVLIASSLLCVMLAVNRLKQSATHGSDWYFMAAWVCMLLGISITAAGVMGLLPSTSIVNNATLISSMLEVYFLLAALIDRYNREKNQSVSALSQALLESQKREQIERHLLFQATHDSLSRLPKKELLISRWGAKDANSLLQHETVSAYIVHFEGYYDQVLALGQEAAEAIVLALHTRLRHYTKNNNAIVRIDDQWSQDKVAVLDTSDMCFIGVNDGLLTSPAELEHLYRCLCEPVPFGLLKLEVKLTIGVATVSQENDLSSTLRRGQVAAKEAANRNLHFLLYDEREGEDPEYSAKLLTRFQQAMQFENLFMKFQPQIDLRTGEVVGFESLLRWFDVEEGVYQSPDHFMPLVEHTGWVGPLAEFVTHYSCRFLQRFYAHFGVQPQISINLSGRNLSDPHLPEKLINIIKSYSISPDKVVFEVTETAFVGDATKAKMILSRLSESGVKIALDDFGTGYSSLNYLRTLPFDKLKIDKSFLDDIDRSSHANTIMAATLALGNELGMDVIAEGVETQQMAERLQAMGCHYCQGFYYAKPLTEAELFEWYAARNSNGTIIE